MYFEHCRKLQMSLLADNLCLEDLFVVGSYIITDPREIVNRAKSSRIPTW